MSFKENRCHWIHLFVLGGGLWCSSLLVGQSQELESATVAKQQKSLQDANPIEVEAKSSHGSWCQWISSEPGTFYDNQTGEFIQSMVLYGNPQWQYSYVHGTDANGEDFHDGESELRRFNLGIRVHLLQNFIFSMASDIADDGEPGGASEYDSFDYTLHNLDMIFDAQSAFHWNDYKQLQLKVGYFKVPSNAGWTESSNSMRAIERSTLSNYASPSNAMGMLITGRRGSWDFDFGVFSGEDITGGSSGGHGGLWLGHLGYLFRDVKRWDQAKANLRILVNSDAGKNEIFDQDWAISLSSTVRRKHWRMMTDVILAQNGDQGASERSGSYWGISVTPSVWILEDQLEAVFRYQYAHSERSEGFRISSHSARRAADAVGADINGGYGDEYQSFYMGLNYYLCGDHTKAMVGFQWDDLESEDRQVYQGLTTWVALRLYF